MPNCYCKSGRTRAIVRHSVQRQHIDLEYFRSILILRVDKALSDIRTNESSNARVAVRGCLSEHSRSWPNRRDLGRRPRSECSERNANIGRCGTTPSRGRRSKPTARPSASRQSRFGISVEIPSRRGRTRTQMTQSMKCGLCRSQTPSIVRIGPETAEIPRFKKTANRCCRWG